MRARGPGISDVMSSLSVAAERVAIPKSAWTFHSVLAIGAMPTATPCARLNARNIAREWGLHNLADTIELVVSELVTNAVKASMDQDQRPITPMSTEWPASISGSRPTGKRRSCGGLLAR